MKKWLNILGLLLLSACTLFQQGVGKDLPEPSPTSPPAETSIPEPTSTSTSTSVPVMATTDIGLVDPPLPTEVAIVSQVDIQLAGMIYRLPESLWQIDTDGTHRLLLDRADAQVLAPGLFLYVENDDIWLFNSATGQSSNLTNTPERIEYIGSSKTHPPGRVLFSSFPIDFELGPGVSGFLTSVGLDGSDYRVLDEEHQSSRFAVSPNGVQVAYGLGDSGFIMNLGSGEIMPFIPAEHGLSGLISIGSPSWSHDGNRIAWIVGFQETEGQPFGFGLAIFNLDDGTALMLHPNQLPGMDGFPPPAVWRPDGEWLAYPVYDIEVDRSGIWLVSADGMSEIHLGLSGNPLWSPDGSKLIYQDSITGLIMIYDTISLQSNVLDFSAKNIQPIGWMP